MEARNLNETVEQKAAWEIVHTVLVKFRLMLPVWQNSTREAMLEEGAGSAGEKVRNFDHLSML